MPKGKTQTSTHLPAKIPHLELDVLVLECLNIEPDGRHCCHGLVHLQSDWRRVENGGLQQRPRAHSRKMDVLPALSSPRMRMRTSLLPNSDENSLDIHTPMMAGVEELGGSEG